MQSYVEITDKSSLLYLFEVKLIFTAKSEGNPTDSYVKAFPEILPIFWQHFSNNLRLLMSLNHRIEIAFPFKNFAAHLLLLRCTRG